MNGAAYDPKTNMQATTSLAKGQNAAATLTGDYVDCADLIGPVAALCMTGSKTGTPDSFTATYSLMEADTSGGSGAQAIPRQDDALVHTVDKSCGWLRGHRTKRYVAVKCVLAFVNGSSPKQDVFAAVTGPKIRP